MKAQEARELGERLGKLAQTEQLTQAYNLLAPVLAERTPFPMLERIGAAVGTTPLKSVNPFLERIAVAKTEGGWVVIGSALGRQLNRYRAGALLCPPTSGMPLTSWVSGSLALHWSRTLMQRWPFWGHGARIPTAGYAGLLASALTSGPNAHRAQWSMWTGQEHYWPSWSPCSRNGT